MKRILLACLLTGFAFAASAQSANVPAAAEVKVDSTAETAEAGKDKLNDRICLRHTGSRVVAQQNQKGQNRCANAAGRAYTKDDLDRTGEVDLADALRKLDPSIY